MTTVQLQLALYATSMPSSSTAAPSSPCSSGPATCSPEVSPSTPAAAIATTSAAPARAFSSRAGAQIAARSSSAATSTAGSAAQATLPIAIGRKHTPDPMLAIPRPTTRAECLQEGRPCPWVSCRHHLLLEVARTKGGRDVRPTSLRLNRPRTGAKGRRPGLASSAAHHVVQQWIDDAVERLLGMRYTCALDVVEEYPDGLTERCVGLVLGVTEKAAHADVERARERLRTGAGLAEAERRRDGP